MTAAQPAGGWASVPGFAWESVRDGPPDPAPDPAKDGSPCAVTLGVFDGVHRGHVSLLCALTHRASAAGLRSVVLTFRNHPLSVLRPDFEPAYLCTVPERIALLARTGVDAVAAVDFTRETAAVSAADFVGLLRDGLGMKALVVGPDFALGRGREGNVEFLQAQGRERGFDLVVVEPLKQGGRRIDSTGIRIALSKGDVSGAALLLGRNFELAGRVVAGHGRGGPLGFPTANLSTDDSLSVPADGIYATWASLQRGPRRVMCAASIGTNPTFTGSERTVEAHLLDFEGDIYGQSVKLQFVCRLRDVERFESAEELRRQMAGDVEMTREMLAAEL